MIGRQLGNCARRWGERVVGWVRKFEKLTGSKKIAWMRFLDSRSEPQRGEGQHGPNQSLPLHTSQFIEVAVPIAPPGARLGRLRLFDVGTFWEKLAGGEVGASESLPSHISKPNFQKVYTADVENTQRPLRY